MFYILEYLSLCMNILHRLFIVYLGIIKKSWFSVLIQNAKTTKRAYMNMIEKIYLTMPNSFNDRQEKEDIYQVEVKRNKVC